MKEQVMEDLVADQIMADYQALYRLAYSYVSNEEDAMDIVQESSYKAIQSCHKIKHREYVRTWLWRIVIHTALDFLRKNKKVVVGLGDYEEGQADKYKDFDTLEALNILEPAEKSIVVLRFFEECRLQEIAELLDMNLNTVKTTLYRSLKKLKIELSEGGTVYV